MATVAVGSHSHYQTGPDDLGIDVLEAIFVIDAALILIFPSLLWFWMYFKVLAGGGILEESCASSAPVQLVTYVREPHTQCEI